MTRPAPNYFIEYWVGAAGVKALPFLDNLTRWDYGVSDADFCDEGGKGPTRFIHQQNTQGSAHSGFEGKGASFYQVSIFDGTEFEFLSSFFD